MKVPTDQKDPKVDLLGRRNDYQSAAYGAHRLCAIQVTLVRFVSEWIS